MRRSQRLIMTTTSTLDGWEVSEYLGPVSAQFVIGTGVFADARSAFTDFFGAHSRSYQKKLDRINEEALSHIEKKAKRIGANAVLGLRVDHDEISGTGKSMLMVTASGTGVRARKVNRVEAPEEHESVSGALTAHELQTSLERRKLFDRAEAGTLNWNDEDAWRFILDNQMEELAPYALRQVESALQSDYSDERKEAFRQKYRDYFLVLAPETAKNHLYACLEASDYLWGFAFRVIRDGKLFDPERVLRTIEDGDGIDRRRCIHLVVTDQPHYSVEDLQTLESLKGAIRIGFSRSEVHTSKGIFGEKEVWKCTCGNEVKTTKDRCRCGLDRYGFKKDTLDPEQASSMLERKLEILRTHLQPA